MIALRDTLRKFVAERDWDQFHSPKNLAVAPSVEAVDLLDAMAQTIDRNALKYPAENVRGSMKKYSDYWLVHSS